MENNVIVKLLDKSTLEEQLAVFRYAFHISEADNIRDKWIEKHYSNPFGNSFIFGAIINNKVVGINCFQPCRYLNDGKSIKVLQSCESGVLPECQGKGVWGKLMRYAITYIESETDYDLIIGFPNYETSYPGFVKMKWDTVTHMGNYVMVNNTKKFSTMLFKNRLFQLCGRLLVLQKYLLNKNANRIKKTVKIATVKLRDALWVFDSNTHVDTVTEWLDYKERYKGLHAINAISNGEVIGSCVFGIIKYNDNPVICINRITIKEDCQYPQKSVFALFCQTISATYPDTVFLRLWATDDTIQSSIIKQLMFKKNEHINPFILKRLNQRNFDGTWDLSFFDLD